MEELCPNAYFLNFSNPESRIILAAGRYTKIKAVGLCHGIFDAQRQIAPILGMEAKDIELLGAGLNHFQWLLEIRNSKTGEDLYPMLKEKEKHFDPVYESFSRKLFRAFNYYPTCGSGHTGEYLPYGYEAGEHGCPFAEADQYRLDRMNEIDERIAGRLSWDEWMNPSGEKGADIITAKINNKKALFESGIVFNNTGAISNLPKDAAVEVPIAVDITGIYPVSITLPDPLARMLTAQVMVQQMAVDAAFFGCKEMALQALLMDPVINSTDAAVKLLDELWEYNKPYIRRHCL
jgi:alpha-galactosidase